ncbi:glycosyltransferase [Adlercreutzia sp. ZJ304]|uniref:glycosyltransferase n=1 Tax=Adlercreutzia sp. ZJ304 TaxID=2709791 RepID=UPI0013ED8968|nr:glycosyltransferase [Adlercreutzia sp. ZJ304]
MQAYIPDIAIVITTYKRQELLRGLLQSIRELEVGPAAIVVVDNEKSSETEAIAAQFNVERYVAMENNTGGAGGFSRGVAEAYQMGHKWFWLMDDDVAVLPNAIEELAKWTLKTDTDLANGIPISQTVGAFQPARRNYDSSFFYWQYKFSTKFGMQNPLASAKRVQSQPSTPINCLCFEGGLVHRRAVEEAGLPDARFFIYADDTIYGYVLSQYTKMLFINDYTLIRTRTMQTMRVGSARKLTPASDMSRYYIMRNRGYMANYLKLYRQYNPLFFKLGTAYTLAKELVRLFVSGSTADKRSSLRELRRGMRDSRAIKHDAQWHPYSKVCSLPHTEA